MEYSDYQFESSEGLSTSLFQDDIYPTVESILRRTDDEAQFLKASCIFEYDGEDGAVAEIMGEIDDEGQVSSFMLMCDYDKTKSVAELDDFTKGEFMSRLVDRTNDEADDLEAEMARNLYDRILSREVNFNDINYVETTVAEYVIDLKTEEISKTFAIMSNLDGVLLDGADFSGLNDDEETDELEDMFGLGGVSDDDIEIIQLALGRMR